MFKKRENLVGKGSEIRDSSEKENLILFSRKAANVEKFTIYVCFFLNRNWKSFSDDEVDYFFSAALQLVFHDVWAVIFTI